MPPKISKATLPPRRSQRATGRNCTVPTSRDPHPPEESTPIVPVNYKNATPDEESQQQRSYFDYNDVGPTTAEVKMVNSGPVRPEISGSCNSSVGLVGEPENKILGSSGPIGPEGVDYSGVRAVVEAGVSGSDSLKEPEKANVGGSSGKRTVVKRVVRVVKKMVRKKVPKKVVKDGGLGIEGAEKIENVVNLDGKNENLEIITSVSECMDVEKASFSGVNGLGIEREEKIENVVNLDGKNENLEMITSVSESVDVEKASSSGVNGLGIEGEERIENVVNLDGKNENLEMIRSVSESMDVEKASSSGVNGLGIEKIENVVNLDGKNENLEMITSVSESMDVEKVSSSGVNGLGIEGEERIANVDDGKNENLEMITSVSESIDVEKASSSGVIGLGIKREEKIEHVVSLDGKNENLEMITSVSESMDVEKVSSSGVNGIITKDSKFNGSVVAEVNAIETENFKLNDSVVPKELKNEDLSDSLVETIKVKEDRSVGSDMVKSNNKKELEVAIKDCSPGLRKVRKVVKKRVIKRVTKRAVAHEEGKNMEDAMNLDEKNEKFQPISNVSDSMVVDERDMSNVGSKEMEDTKCNDALQLELKNEDSRDILVDGNGEENKNELNVGINEKSVVDKRLEDQSGNKTTSYPTMLPASDKPFSLEAVRAEDHLGTKNMVPVEDERTNNQLERKNVGLVEDENMVPEGETNGADGVKGAKEPSESNSDMMNEGLVWSGEMEALERRKRRKTEIFVGGLDKDANEEDIRKVFEAVGEIVEVRLMMNSKTGRNKGFAFIRYTSADAAAKAITKYDKVEIRGKECSAKPVEGNDTIYLGNINRNWKTEDIVKLLKEAGIDKIDKVTIIADPRIIERNRGFAFVEFETCKDAQTAFHKLQTKDAFGSHHQQIKVEWAQQLVEPDEEEILKVKSVYAEYLPPSWDEEEVREHFKRFGEIENVTLAKSRPSSRRKDFAFVNFTSREAALACIEAFNREQIDNGGSKVQLKVSLANPLPKGKQTKHLVNPKAKELPKEKLKAAQPIIKPPESRNKRKHAGNSHEGVAVERSSTNVELVQLLRQQAQSGQAQPGLGTGFGARDHQSLSRGSKRPFSTMVNDPRSSDRRGFPQLPSGRSYPVQIPASSSYGVSMASSSYYRQQGINYASESVSRGGNYHSQFQTRQQAFYYDNNGVLRRY